MRPPRSLEERLADADSLAAYHLGDAHEAEERGDLAKAEKFRLKSKFWFDRYKLLSRQTNRIDTQPTPITWNQEGNKNSLH
jgi:hypothetical protein